MMDDRLVDAAGTTTPADGADREYEHHEDGGHSHMHTHGTLGAHSHRHRHNAANRTIPIPTITRSTRNTRII